MKAQKPSTDAGTQPPFLELQEVAAATNSPVQLVPLAKVAEESNLSAPELSFLFSTVAAAVESFPVDDNSFYSDGDYPAIKAKVQLVKLASNKHISANDLTHSYHEYLNRSLNGPHCTGNGPRDFKELVALYESFNRSPAASDQEVEPLSSPASAPPLESVPDEGQYWLSPKAQKLLIDAKHLNFDDKWRPYTDTDRKTPEWQDRVRQLLDDMDDWRPTDEPSPADYYHQPSTLHVALSDLDLPSPVGTLIRPGCRNVDRHVL